MCLAEVVAMCVKTFEFMDQILVTCLSSLTICCYAPNEHLPSKQEKQRVRESVCEHSTERVELSMELALGAMAGLAPKLGDLLMQEYVVQKGLKPDIVSLSRELVTMKAGLEDLSKVPPEQLTEVEKLWARHIRELSYDMEDAVDDFVLRVAGGECAADANVFKKILGKAAAAVKKVKHRRQISDKVKDIKKLSNELAGLRAKYTVRGAGADLAMSTGIDPRVLNLYKKESDLVGIEESRNKVIKMLSIGTKDDAYTHASELNLKIVSIVGVGGLGKTTLAKTVHDMLKNQFGCSAFISVGRTPSLTRTFEKMLVELDKNYKQVDMARWDIERFGNELHEFLQDKRYFIVVDDIWDVESWEAIRYALKDNNCGSRIIITTRNLEVATKAGEVYRLKHLSDGNSRILFYKRIQSQEGESLDGVSGELSSKIIDKCDGIPLAIIAIASLLVERPYEDWSIVYDSIGFGNGDNTTKILSYSYYDLPSYLKPCLLHLSILTEDSIRDRKSVIWMWIGEGFVHPGKKEGSQFEVGERYFNELVNRSLIQPMDNDFTQCFCIHDIVFDLIRKLSGIENFVTILDSSDQHASLDSLRNRKKTGMTHTDNKVRRLVVRNHHVQCFPEDTMPEVLRSFNIEDSKIEIMDQLHRFRVCRVLHLQGCYVPISLKHIGRLLHLKYLGISYIAVNELPMELGHLKSLQALVLVDIGLDELPPAVCSLTQLMCLIAEGFKRFPADRMGNLTSLEELRLETVAGRSTTEDLVVGLGKLTRLRMVKITFSEKLDESLQKALVRSLCNLRELQELVLASTGLSQQGATMWEGWEPPMQLRRLLIYGIRFSRLPGWINRSRLPRLCFLFLGVYTIEVQDLDNLASLLELSYLDLGGYSWPPGYTVGTDGFRNLRFCKVGTALKFHMGAMPRLEELQFKVYAGYWSWVEDGVPLEQFPTKEVIEDLDLGLDNLLSLEKVIVQVDCSGATAAEVQEVEAMVTRAVENHPNRPTIKMDRECEGNILSDERRVALLQQHIERHLGVLEWKDAPDAQFISYLRKYRHLQKAVNFIDCAGARMCEVEKVEAAFRRAAELHPNHPTIQLIRTNTDEMVSSSDRPDTELDDDHDDSPDNLLCKLQLRN
ncbi:putative disease resistance RPP13-like protein 3 [Sorghum bicolor]|nr:putative disease resistance RPP13-like protein 3 [Sorghum bicolor]|eukprot:XP_021301298.1 putative disease resistance RPP13-like protein 3 [Sorghum bicolor]